MRSVSEHSSLGSPLVLRLFKLFSPPPLTTSSTTHSSLGTPGRASRSEELPPDPLSDLLPDLFIYKSQGELYEGLFQYLLSVDVGDRSEPVKSARFLSYIAPYWFCGDTDLTVTSRPIRLKTLNKLVKVLEESRAFEESRRLEGSRALEESWRLERSRALEESQRPEESQRLEESRMLEEYERFEESQRLKRAQASRTPWVEESRALTSATLTDCILCAGAAMYFPLHPKDLIRFDKRCAAPLVRWRWN
jgi:hypothetical protein